MKSLRRVITYLWQYKFFAIGATLSLFLVTATNLITPQLLRWMIDRGMTVDGPPTNLFGMELGNQTIIIVGTIGLALVAVSHGVFNFTQAFWSEQASQSVAYDLRNELYEKIQGLSFSYHDRAQTGQLMTRATNDVDILLCVNLRAKGSSNF